MIIVMNQTATKAEIDHVIEKIRQHNFDVHPDVGSNRTVLGIIGDARALDPRDFELLPGVSEVLRVTEPYKLASRSFHPNNTVIDVKSVQIGGDSVIVMAGPCAIESEEQLSELAPVLKNAGAQILRAGAFKPRSSPYSFQGMGEKGLRWLKATCEKYDLVSVSEVMSTDTLELMTKYVDILQIGTRNMQNFPLLKAVGATKKPVLLKRGLSATYEEWLMAAEYILSCGNPNVIFCERGIRTFETYTRNTMDIAAIPVIKHLSHLPIIADPSHGTGRRDKVIPMARAAVAAGADGLMIEVHAEPDKALSDGAQSLYPDQFEHLMKELNMIAQAIGRPLGGMTR